MESRIVGFVATSTSIVAFSSQFIHTLQSKNTEGVSLYRTVFDSVSLFLWVYYAARGEDNPLLIATSCEAFTCLCVCLVILRHYVKDGKVSVTSSPNHSPPLTPPPTPIRKDSLVDSEAKYVIISIKPPIKIDTIVI